MLNEIVALTTAFEAPALLCLSPRELVLAAKSNMVGSPFLTETECKALSRLPNFSLNLVPITDSDIDKWIVSAGYPKPEKPGFNAEPGEVAIILKDHSNSIKGFMWLDLDFDWNRQTRGKPPEQTCMLRCIDLSVAAEFRSETLYKVMLYFGIQRFLQQVVSPMLAQSEFPTEIQLDCVAESITPTIAEYGDTEIDRYLTAHSKLNKPTAGITFLPMAGLSHGLIESFEMAAVNKMPNGGLTVPSSTTRH